MDYRFYIIYVCLNSYDQRLSCSANCEDRVQNKEYLVENLKNIVGDSYVIHEPEDLIVFEQDASVDRSIPLAVVFPASTEEVSDVVSFAYENEIPIVARGAGTGLSGGAIADNGGFVIALTRMTDIIGIDIDNKLATVEPGVVNIDLSNKALKHGLYFAPDPSSQKTCSIGGNVAENSGGPHCLAYGVTTNHVLGMEVVLADGSVRWFGNQLREHQGYDLRGIMVGSEGTLGIVTKIVVRLLNIPESTKTLLVVFKELSDASAAVSAIIGAGIVPAAIEMMDQLCIEAAEAAVHAGYPDGAGAVLLVEVDGFEESVNEESQEIENICRAHSMMDIKIATDYLDRERLWTGRKSVLGALGRLAPNYYLMDGTIPRTKLMDVLNEINKISEKYHLPIANLLHAGDGNLHPAVLFNERKDGETVRALKAGGEILKLCVESGGVLSGEHGIGLEKQEYMPLMFTDDDMQAMQQLMPAFGTKGLLNPGKIFPKGEPLQYLKQSTAISNTGTGAYI